MKIKLKTAFLKSINKWARISVGIETSHECAMCIYMRYGNCSSCPLDNICNTSYKDWEIDYSKEKAKILMKDIIKAYKKEKLK